MIRIILKKIWLQLFNVKVLCLLYYKTLCRLQRYNCAYFDDNILEAFESTKYSSNFVIDIIIPVYNGFEYLQPLFESVYKNTNQKFRMIIINDFSSDLRVRPYLNKLTFISEYCQELIIKDNKENLGFVKTVNAALKYVKNNFIILNTDTEVPLGWSHKIIRPIEENLNIASCTPWTNCGILFSFPNWLKDNQIFLNLDVDKIDKLFSLINLKTTMIEVPTGMGFCMAFNKVVVDNIGMFDELTFGKGYGEENDWCMRATKYGYRSVFVTNLFVYHKHGGSFPSKEKQRYIQENSLKLYKKHPDFLLLLYKFIAKKAVLNISLLMQMIIIHDVNAVRLIVSSRKISVMNHYVFNVVVKSEHAITIIFLLNGKNQQLRLLNFAQLILIYKLLNIQVEDIDYISDKFLIKKLQDYTKASYNG